MPMQPDSPKPTLGSLRKAVQLAFPVKAIPRPTELFHGVRYRLEPAMQRLFDHLQGRAWSRIEPMDFEQQQGMVYLTDKAFQYYLPAFLLNSASSVTDPDDITLEFTVSGLDPFRDARISPHLDKRFRGLSRDQRNAVLMFMIYVTQVLPRHLRVIGKKKALDYWHRLAAEA